MKNFSDVRLLCQSLNFLVLAPGYFVAGHFVMGHFFAGLFRCGVISSWVIPSRTLKTFESHCWTSSIAGNRVLCKIELLERQNSQFYIKLDFQISKKFNNGIHKFLRYAMVRNDPRRNDLATSPKQEVPKP
jgi:hypothetical protein